MQHSKNDIWVGLFVLLGAAALVFLALQSANLLNLNFRSGYTVTARFDNIGGLKPKAAVRSAGVVVGRVQYIGIEPGADENNLAEGDMVTATQSAVVLENLIGQFLYGKAEEGASSNA